MDKASHSGLPLKIRRLSFQDVDPSADGLRAMETSKCRRLYFPPGIYVGRKTAYCEEEPHPRLRRPPLLKERGHHEVKGVR